MIGVPASRAFALFLREGDVDRQTRSALRLILTRHGDLLAGVAAARTKGIDHLKDFDPRTDLRRDALRSLTWVVALLHAIGRFSSRTSEMSKDALYTEDVAFQLGQFIAAVDVIHVGYCSDVRGGDIPPNLLGNAVLSIAGSDPVRALSILSTRMKPYLAWAKRADQIHRRAHAVEKEGAKNRAFAMRQGLSCASRIRDVARELQPLLAPYERKLRKPDDVFRAELLLGYVAGLPKKEKTAADGDPDGAEGLPA